MVIFLWGLVVWGAVWSDDMDDMRPVLQALFISVLEGHGIMAMFHVTLRMAMFHVTLRMAMFHVVSC